ncbi:uncharacterized protein [Penaeus vannamei]|uniref:uncharacterized protein n=1 Tax=Penaeus vannamei TaxID=6689 RepID=UPI00387FA70C
MANAAVVRSPTTERLYSPKHKNPISKSRGPNENASCMRPDNLSEILRDRALSGKPRNFARISGKPRSFTRSPWKLMNNSHTLWSRNYPHLLCGSHTSGEPQTVTDTRENYRHTSWGPRESTSSTWARGTTHSPWESYTTGKPRSYTLTSWESGNSTPGTPESPTLVSGKPNSTPELNPLKTPPKEKDQQKEDSANIQEIRHPSKKRNSFGHVEIHQKDSIHQEKRAEQSLKAKVRLDAMFEKENQNGIAKGQGKKGKLSLRKIPIYVKCYTCGNLVKDVHFEEHLFFGETECTQCNWKISSCQAFCENKIDQIMGNSTCLHTLTYCMTPSEYISNNLSQESPLELDNRLTLYVSSLKQLTASEPWKNAIVQCQNFLNGESSEPSGANEEPFHALETETVLSLPIETVPISKQEIKNSPAFVNDGELILSQSYDLEHLNDIVEIEIAKDSPKTWGRSPLLFPEFSGDVNMSPNSQSHRQINVDTCGNLIRDALQSTSSLDVASQSTSSRDLALQSTGSWDVALQRKSSLDIALQSTSSRDVVLQSTSSRDVALQSTSSWDVASQSTSLRDVALQSTSSRDVALQSTSSLDVASQSTSSSDIARIAGGLNSTQLQKRRKTKPKPSKRSKPNPDTSSLQASNAAEKKIIETPSNGHYLIVRHAIEECPMCYTEFCPSRFTVNINTFLLSTVCTGCDLTVYIVFDPPDGSAPKIVIETESGPPVMQKDCASKRKNTGHEGKSRVRNFFKR